MPSSITCQRCHSVNEPFATTCQNCGARFCPSCKLVIDSPSARICPHCGKADITFKPGKYAGGAYIAAGVSSAPVSQSYCSNCGSKIEPGARKCPYCGRLGPKVVTQTPVQGFGVMKPAHGEPEPLITMQKICQKCGAPIPPGSSLCAKHAKYGQGSTLRQSIAPKDKTIEAEAYRKMASRGTGEAAPPGSSPARHMTPPDIYPPIGAGQQPDTEGQRICPNCGSPVPDRSKVCPNCGWNRLPQQKSRPIIKAEEYYKSREGAPQPYATAIPQPDPYYGQPAVQPDPYYGQPAAQPMQPYEMAYPATASGFSEEILPDKKRRKEKKPKEEAYLRPGTRQKKSPWPMLLALLALAGVIIIAAVLILDMLKTPAAPVLPPTSNNPGSVVPKGPVISNIQFTDIGRTSATITWTTDKPSNSVVIYCLEGGNQCENAKDDALVTGHNVKLTDLEQGKAYHITVKSMVSDVDTSQDAPYVLRTTDVADTVPPKISEVEIVNLVGTSATVTWSTDEPSTSQVIYGTSTGYGTSQPEQTDTTLLTNHNVILNGLPPQTTLHYKVVSRDAAGNEASSSDATFATPRPPGTSNGDTAPDFTLTCADGSSVTLSELRGKKVIINFWNTQCHYCMEELPFFQTIRDNNPENAVAILAINSPAGGFPSNRPEYVGSVINEAGYTFIVPMDETGQVAQAYDITNGIPVTFFLDSSGIIRAKQDGAFSSANNIQNMLSY